jgi:hypothetical protein
LSADPRTVSVVGERQSSSRTGADSVAPRVSLCARSVNDRGEAVGTQYPKSAPVGRSMGEPVGTSGVGGSGQSVVMGPGCLGGPVVNGEVIPVGGVPGEASAAGLPVVGLGNGGEVLGGTPVVMVDGVWEAWEPDPALPAGHWLMVVRAGSGPPRAPAVPVGGAIPQQGPPEPALQVWALPAFPWMTEGGTLWRSPVAARWSKEEMDAPTAAALGELALIAEPSLPLISRLMEPPPLPRCAVMAAVGDMIGRECLHRAVARGISESGVSWARYGLGKLEWGELVGRREWLLGGGALRQDFGT